MKVEMYCCADGADKIPEGTTAVMIDIFRAGNTIQALLEKKAAYVIPVKTLSQARALKELYRQSGVHDVLLVGEVKSFPPEGFDYGNSPSQIYSCDEDEIREKIVIMKTSSGTQGLTIAKERGAKEILVANFRNVYAVIDYLRTQNPEHVSLMHMGFSAQQFAQEDSECAVFIKTILDESWEKSGETGLYVNPLYDPSQPLVTQEGVVNYQDSESLFKDIDEILRESDGAERLKRNGFEEDLEFILQIGENKSVPKDTSHFRQEFVKIKF